MSMCSGKTMCNIYRSKRYCRASDKKEVGIAKMCKCVHACYPCEVDICVMQDVCKMRRERISDE